MPLETSNPWGPDRKPDGYGQGFGMQSASWSEGDPMPRPRHAVPTPPKGQPVAAHKVSGIVPVPDAQLGDEPRQATAHQMTRSLFEDPGAETSALAAVQQAQAEAPKARPGWVWVVLGAGLGLVCLIVGIAIGASNSRGLAPASSAPSVTETVGPRSPIPAGPLTPTRDYPGSKESAALAPVPVVPPTTAPVSFGNGQWIVPAEVVPGTYRSLGPENGVIPLCYVDTTDSSGKITAQETSSDGPVRIRVAAGETIKAAGCQTFQKVS